MASEYFFCVTLLSCYALLPCHGFLTSEGPLHRYQANNGRQARGSSARSLLIEDQTRQHFPKIDSSSFSMTKENCDVETASSDQCIMPSSISRRSALLTVASAAFLPLAASASTTTVTAKSLEDLALGDGMWKKLSEQQPTAASNLPVSSTSSSSNVPAYFVAYAARFLINYDEGISSWWKKQQNDVSLLPVEGQEAKLGRVFGSLARSIQIALENYLASSPSQKEAYTQILRMFLTTYADASNNSNSNEAKRQIGLLFSMLPAQDQPSFQVMNQFATQQSSETPEKPTMNEFVVDRNSYEPNNPVPTILSQDLGALLPEEFRVASIKDSNAHRIYPAISLYEVGFDEEFGQTAVGTSFGPISSTPLKRQQPDYSPFIYGLFGISGATGCALTHSVVIPLDVVKTRSQTDPEVVSNLLEGAQKIVQREGIQGLFLGAQATLAGYFWYGLSVYPSYTFFKRFFSLTVLPPEVSMVHVNDVALLAGACAAVIASLGLTPLEAARIRVVAEPEKYRPLGLTGTLAVIAEEDADLGWKGLYAGLPSLLTRQVIFGSIKFLAFERASEAIFAAAPSLRDATWTALAVSLVAGGLSGTISSIVSQPADSVLTYAAQNSRGTSSMGIIEGCRVMVEEEGAGSLFRGLGSRCVWAGTIIAGQFLLYDVFRTIFKVGPDDLSQVYQVILPTVQS